LLPSARAWPLSYPVCRFWRPAFRTTSRIRPASGSSKTPGTCRWGHSERHNTMKTAMHPIHHKPLIIAGPCSAETEEQVIETALQLKRTGAVSMLRAGIWKPRTRPGHFEGVGVKALPWLVRAKQLTGLPFAVEVATPRQVEDALSFEADM